MDGDTIWLACALVLVIEGLFPFASLAGWRRTFFQLLQMSDGQIRFFGLASILIGMLLFWWVAP